MDNYVQCALTKFNHIPPDKAQHTPHSWNATIYLLKVAQILTPISQSPPLEKKVTRQIQSIAGMFLYYSDIDPSTKPALNKISSQQSSPTEDTNDKATILFNYISTYPNGVI